MKAYNLNAKEIELSFGKISALVLGERGRGRWQVIVPAPKDIKDGSGVCIGKTKTGKNKIVFCDDKKGWLARVSTEGRYVRGATGFIKANPAKVKIIEAGNGAYGDAGRLGTWKDYLLQIEDNTFVYVKPTRASTVSPYYLYFSKDNVYRVEREELDIFLDNMDIEFDEDKMEQL